MNITSNYRFQNSPYFRANISAPVNMSKNVIRGIEKGTITKHFVPTPVEVIDLMIKFLGKIKPNDKILEPSAGYGHIADRLVQKAFIFPNQLDVIEPNNELRKILFRKGHNLVDYDVLKYNPNFQYDKIIMNPPYENGNDILHLLHCFKLLKPNGIIACILPESSFIPPKQVGYERWQKDWLGNGEIKEINEYLFELLKSNDSKVFELGNVFEQSDVPDDVLTRMVIIRKLN